MAFSQEQIKEDLELFCDDVFRSLVPNIEDRNVLKEEYNWSRYRLTVANAKKWSHFTQNTEKAVHTLAYLYRTECHYVFDQNSHAMEGNESFKNYIMQLVIPKDNYFCRLLAWIAFVYELTMHCYMKQGNYYLDTSRRCLKRFIDIKYFQNGDQWDKFIQTADRIAFFYDPLVNSFGDEFPKSDILAPFQFTLKETLILYRYKLKTTKIMMFKNRAIDEYKRSSKLRPLWSHNPEQFRFGHTVFRKDKCANKPSMSSKENSTASERGVSASEMQCDPGIQMDDVLFERGPSTSSAASNANGSGSEASGDKEYREVDAYKNSFFVISERYCATKTGENYASKKRKQYFKIYSPSRERLEKVENLNSRLEENINTDNTKSISKELVVVGSRDCNDIKDDNLVIVVDSSSEKEDDDEFDPCQRSFIDHVLQRWKTFSLQDVEMMHFVLKSRFWERRLN